ncbi:MAG: hypothetical protein K6F28_11195 [Lachnospiraceae bacterium]|nr:hypothetical protein [Lachnospiraceae bacterium]
MTGLGNSLLSSYTAHRSSAIPRNSRQVLAGFVAGNGIDKPAKDVSRIRRALRSGAENLASETRVNVIDNMDLYRKALEKQRKTSKDTSLAKQKLKYSFKKISSRIISSKTSSAAREVVSQARREIQNLKRARRSGKYDDEEIDAAIDHAKAMERIARKKVRHLEEEEMAKRSSSETERDTGPAVPDDAPADAEDPDKKEIEKLRDELGRIEEKAENKEYIESEEVTNEMISEITEGMEEMLDAIEELNDLMNELVSAPAHMDREDIRTMTIKHRNKEMKEITKADADYLKVMFDRLEEVRTGAACSGAASAGMTPSEAPASVIDVAL